MEKYGNTDIDFEFTEGPGTHPTTGQVGVVVTTHATGEPITIWGATREEALQRAKREVDARRILNGQR